MKKIKLVSLIFFCVPIYLPAQKRISASRVDNLAIQSLTAHFLKYSLFKINTAELKSDVQGHANTRVNVELHLPGISSFNLSLQENDIRSAGYQLTASGIRGKQLIPKSACITYSGELLNESASSVRLTITPDLVYGIIKTNTTEYFIEPLSYFSKNTTPGVFVVYETKDAILDPSLTCGVSERDAAKQKILHSERITAGLNCVRTELAIASDASMFGRYGSVDAVETHNIGVMNNVIWDYTNSQFNNNIEFVIVAQYVSTAAANDPLTPAYTGTNSNIVLPNFRTWGQNGNFGVNYDLGQFWTTRNLDNDGAGTNNGIVGLAYVGGVCSSDRYQILEDFTGLNPSGSGFALEILAAHETGHGFNCVHDADGSPYIMAPSISNTHVWSPASISAVDAFVNSSSCLAKCNISEPLKTDFAASPVNICTGGTVQFFDRSLGGPTSWRWTFEGGTPLVSTDRNPIVSFSGTGIKNVVLSANNGVGTDVKGSTIIVTEPHPAACTHPGTGTSNAGINSFRLNTINKVTGGLAADGNKYLDFTCSDNTVLTAGTKYLVSVNVGTSTPTKSYNLVQFFIDYNNDGDFTDAGEFIYSSSTTCYIGNDTFSFATLAAPPLLNQLLRARVIAKDCVGGVNSCYEPTAGQVEDYGVIFLAPQAACSINYWTGVSGVAWEDPSNWSCGTVPDAGTNVIIGPGKSNYPEIRSMATCKSLHNVSATTIKIVTGFKLNIVGSN